MQVVKSVRVKLAIDDIYEHIPHLTKQQILQKFRILLDRKQIQVNQKIQKNSAQYLLVLQKKILAIERKEQQIVNLNNKLTSYKNQLQELTTKNSELTEQLTQLKQRQQNYQKKFTQYLSIYKQQKNKKEQLKKQYDKLLIQHKQLKQMHIVEVRNHKKIKDEKIQWKEQTQFLLNNLIKKHQVEIQTKIDALKSKTTGKIIELEQSKEEEKRKRDNYKDKYNQSKKNCQNLKRNIDVLNKLLENERNKKIIDRRYTTASNGTQDNENTNQNQNKQQKQQKQGNSIGTQTTQTTQTTQINEIKILELVGRQSQTQQTDYIQLSKVKSQYYHYQFKQSKQQKYNQQQNKVPTLTKLGFITQLKSTSSQTIFTPLQPKQQKNIIDQFRKIVSISNHLIEHWKKKYEELQNIFLLRPLRPDNKIKIQQLQLDSMDQQKKLMQQQSKIQTLQYINFQLRQKILQLNNFIESTNMQQISIKNLPMNNSQTNSSPSNSTCITFRIGSKTRQKKLPSKPHQTNSHKNIHLLPDTDITYQKQKIQQQKQSDNHHYFSPSCIKVNTLQDQQLYLNSKNKCQQLDQVLQEKGITFQQTPKIIFKKYLSETRQYKKFKSSCRKTYF